MNTHSMMQQQIRMAGVEILSRYMGITGMIRFLQQNEVGHGDYTRERDKLLGNPSMEQLVSEIQSSELNKNT